MRSNPSNLLLNLAASDKHPRWLGMLTACALVVAGMVSPAVAADLEWELGLQPRPVHVQMDANKAKPGLAAPKAGQVQVLQDAADWLIAQQLGNGGFPWTVGGGGTANTQGATALGLLRAYAHTADTDHLDAAVANGGCHLAGIACISGFQFTDGDHRFATHDPLFLQLLTSVSGDPAYADLVQVGFWSKLAAGEYGEGNNFNAHGYASAVMASRNGGGIPELVAWDLSKVTIAAHLAGQSTAHAAFIGQVINSLNAASPTHDTYDVIGLAGGLWAGAATGTNVAPISGNWASANSNAGLAVLLLNYQAPNGGFVSSSSQTVENGNASGQTTAFAIQALQAVNPVTYQVQIANAFAYIASLQQPGGQYLGATGASPTMGGGIEVHGEILEAYGDLWIRSDRYVAPGGSNVSNDCSIATNPCASIQHAVNEADIGNIIHIAAGTYAEASVTVDKVLTLSGDGTATTTLAGALNITASGSASTPIRFEDFTVSNPVGHGTQLGGTVSYLSFQNIAFDGNTNGVRFAGTGNENIFFYGPDCAFTNNNFGVITSSNAVATQVSFTQCRFENNGAGIVLFGGANSGTGQLESWAVVNSQFIGNNDDTGGWGGGIWIKTAGAGSGINGFTVVGSLFRDNGSTNSLNRTGISVRARPDTTMQGVVVCGNTFEDTGVAGTQITGINVYDQTDNTGYTPIQICADNTFTNLGRSVSGLEQFTLLGTKPVVNVTGGTLLNWEHLYFPSTSVVYVDEDFAGSVNGQALTFAHADPAADGQNVTFGVNAFATIPAGLANVTEGGTVYIAAGTHPGFTLAKHAVLIGNDSDRDGVADADDNTLIEGHVVIDASGADAANPVALRNLEVNNTTGSAPASGFGITLTGNNAFIELSDLRVWGNVQHGLWVAAVADISNLVVRDSTFDQNGYTAYPGTESVNVGAGFSTSQNAAAVSNVLIENSDFLDNAFGGVVINNGNSGGTSQVTGWEISGGNFLRNNQATTNGGTSIDTPFGAGGGMWIKTSGAGSQVSNIHVHGAYFADNGSAREVAGRMLNRNGIAVRSRPSATLGAVRICGNTFEETVAAGTQEAGVYVYDQAGSAGYTPVEICDEGGTPNTFINLVHSVSGYEQNQAGNGDAVVNITSTTPLTGWEHLSFPTASVVYVDDAFGGYTNGATASFIGNPAAACAATTATYAVDAFATITEALAHVVSGGTVCVAAGVYAENVQISAPVAIFGAQAGVDARTRTVGDANETVVVPAATHPSISLTVLNTAGQVVEITAAGVTLDGLVLDGDNPDETSGIDMNGADVDVGMGVSAGNNGGVRLSNTIIRNVPGTGFLGIGQAGDNAISQNRFANISAPSSWGVGVVAANSYYVTLTENLFDEVRVGVQTNNTRLPNPGGLTPAIGNNVFNVQRTGIFHNLFTDTATAYSISGNAFHAVDHVTLTTGQWQAIWLQSMGSDQTIVIENNDIDGGMAPFSRNRVGYLLNNVTTTALAETRVIQGGSVSNVEIGVLSTDATFYTGAVNDFIVRDVDFNNIPLAALYVEDTDEEGGSARLTVGADNTFTGVTYEAALSGPDAVLTYTDSVAGLDHIFVRSAGPNYWEIAAQNSNFYTVQNAEVADGIAAASVGGTVELEAGTFAQNVIVDKAVSLIGPHAGVHGNAGSRGTDEAVVSPASGVGIRLDAADVTVDGLTIGSSGGHAVQRRAGDAADNLSLINNRIVDVTNGSGVFSEPGSVVGAGDGFLISRNLFGNIAGSGPTGGRGIVLFKGTSRAQVIDNDFVAPIQLHALQVNGGSGAVEDVAIVGNRIAGTSGTALVITGTTGVSVENNTVSSNSGGLFISDRTVDFTARCNVIAASGSGFSSADFFFDPLDPPANANSNIRIFHNAISGGSVDLSNGMAQGLIVGSNWYDGTAPAISGSAIDLLVADPLLADPTNAGAFDVGDCGDNTAVSLALVSGSPQSANLNQPFATALRARVEDALGGAVMGEGVAVAAPGAGASAYLTASIGGSLPNLVSNYNGEVEVTAIANGHAGTYPVNADAGAAGEVDFMLTNVALPQVVFDLNGPVGGVAVGAQTAYTGFIGNDDPGLTEPVYLRLSVSGSTPLVPGDVQLSVVNPAAPPPLLPLVWTQSGNDLIADFPGDATGGLMTSFTLQPTPYAYLHNFRVVYGKAGIFTAQVEVVGETSGTVYATDVISTEVIAEHAGVALNINGPVAGVEKDAPTAYTATLTNSEAEVADNVLVELVFTRDGGIAGGDLTVEYDTGSGFDTLVLDASTPGQLSALFGPPGGFTLTEPYDETTAFRVTYHQAPDTFRVAATVVDAVPDTDGVPTYAADNHATDVVLSDPDVSLDYEGPFATPESSALVGAKVGEAVYYRSRLENHGIDDVADLVYAPFKLTADYALADDDVSVLWWPAAPTCGAAAPGSAMALTLTEDGSGGLDGVVGMPSFTLNGGEVLEVCYEVVFAHVGEYSIAAEIRDVGTDTDDFPTYAATNLTTAVAKGEATVTLSDLGPHAFDNDDHEATVDTDPAGLDVDVTYNGGTDLPRAVGSYSVVATVVSDDWEGSASGVLEIVARDVTLTLAGGHVGVAHTDPVTVSTYVTDAWSSDAGEDVVIQVQVSRGGGIAPGDVALSYVLHPLVDPGQTQNAFGLAACGANLCGTFEPGGFTLPPASLPATWSASATRGGQYTTTASVVGIDSGTVYATAAHTVDVADLQLSGSGNAAGAVGVPVDTSVALSNIGTAGIGSSEAAPNDENVRGRFSISLPGETLAPHSDPGGTCGNPVCASPDVHVEFLNPGDGLYYPIYNLRSDGSGGLYGHFGALSGGGIPVPAGFSGAFQFRTTFKTYAGNYATASEVVGIDTGKVYAQAPAQAILVGRGQGTVAFDVLSDVYGTAHAVTATIIETGEACDPVTGVPAAADPVGSYSVSATCAGVAYDATGSASYTVTPATAGITVDDAAYQFTGAPQSVTADTTPAGVAHSITYEGTGGTAYPVTTVAPSEVGTYAVTATLTDPNYLPASDTATLTIGNTVVLTLDGDEVGVAHTDPVTYSLFEADAYSPAAVEPVVVEMVLTRQGGIAPGDVALEWSFDGIAYNGFALVACGTDLCGSFDAGSPTGFTLPASSLPTIWRASSTRGGHYTVTSQIVGEASGTVYASATHSVDVADLTLSLAPMAIATEVGATVDTSVTMANIGTATLSSGASLYPPTVPAQPAPNDQNVRGRFTIELVGGTLAPAPGIPGDSPDAAVEFYNVVTGTYERITLRDGGAGTLVGYFGSLSNGGLPVSAGFSGTNLFRTTFLTYTGTYNVVWELVGVDADLTDTGVVYASSGVQTFTVGTGAAASIELVSGDLQMTTVDNPFPAALVVAVKDIGGNPVEGAAVAFNAVAAGNGASSSDGGSTTVATGQAQFIPAANTIAGSYTVRASIANGEYVDFLLTNLADEASALVVVSGDAQSTVVDTDFTAPLVVQLEDQHGNAVETAGVEVGFAVTPAGNGASAVLAVMPVLTDADGRASSGMLAANGTAGGPYVVTASAAGLVDAQFSLTNTEGTITVSNIRWADDDSTSIAFDGNDRTVTFDTLPAIATGDCTVTYNAGSTLPHDAGSYVVQVTCVNGFGSGSGNATLTITPAATGNTGIVLTGGTFVYDGTPKPATVSNPDGVAYTLSYDTGNGLPPMAVGSYEATVTVTDPNHASDTLTAMIEITAAEVTLTFDNLTHVYDGSPKAATVTTTPAGVTGISLAYSPDAAPTDAGSYVVTATLSNPNYVLAGADTATLVIDQATAQIFLSNLTHVYDGSVKFATVSTVPASLAGDVVVTYTPANPINLGNYAVSAALTGHPNYANASASGTLTIVAATIAGFEIVGDDTFSGVAGQALSPDLPTVRVFDTGNNGVASIGVLFSVTAGNGSILGSSSATVSTDASGEATVPEWVLGAVAGGNTMTATVSLPGLPVLTFNATGTQEAAVSIDKNVDLAQAHAGQVLTWSIVVANAGPSTAEVELLDALPDGVESITWTCVEAGDAVCGEVSGNGDIEFTSTLPAGGSITVLVSATVSNDAAIGTMTNEASATWETDAASDSADTNIIHADTGPCSIFCDGFEDEPEEGKALAMPGEAMVATSSVSGWMVHPAGTDKPGVALELLDASSRAVAWLDTVKAGDAQLIRVRQRGADGVERAGTWSQRDAGVMLGYGWDLTGEGLVLRFGKAGALDLHLPAGTPIPESARALRAAVR